MELIDGSVLARTVFFGSENVEVSAGKKFKIDTSPQGEEVLDVEVPAGKQWSVNVYVQIIETEV